MKTPTREQLQNLGSLITYKCDDKDCCLGELIHFPEHGTFDPNFGRVDVTKEEADIHNKLLDTAMLEGMDKKCQIGQGSHAYYVGGKVTTFIGTVISEDVAVKGLIITFRRGGKVYRGHLSRRGDSFNYRRVS